VCVCLCIKCVFETVSHRSFDVRTSFGRSIWHMRAHSTAGATLGLMHTSCLRRSWSACCGLCLFPRNICSDPLPSCHGHTRSRYQGICSGSRLPCAVQHNTADATLKLNDAHRAEAGTGMEAGGERAGSGHRSTERDERERRQQSDPSVEGRQAGHRGASLDSHLRRSSQSGVGVWNMRVLHHSSADGSATARVTSK